MYQDFRTLVKTASEIQNVNWAGQTTEQYPAIDLYLVSSPGEHEFGGPRRNVESLVQVDVYAETFADALALSQKVLSLNGYSGDGLRVLLRQTRQSSPTGLYRFSHDFRVFHTIS